MSKKSFIDTVEVKSPCGEDWGKMTGSDEVRFCSHCAKSVNNISAISRKEAMRLVRASNGELCIRVYYDVATKRPVFADQLLQITRNRPRIAAGVMSASISLSAAGAFGQSEAVPPPVKEAVAQVSLVDKVLKTETVPQLTGVVTDPAGAVIPNARIRLVNIREGKVDVISTDADGEYKAFDLKPGSYMVETESEGFASRSSQVSIGEGTPATLDIALDVKPLNVVVEVAGGEQIVLSSVGGAVAYIEYDLPLSKAVSENDIEKVRDLLARGANPNGKEKNYDSSTPLFIAVENGDIEIVKTLLDAGAKVNAKDDQKQTPLMQLDSDSTPELVQLLISHGANIENVDKGGNTALMIAAGSASPEVLKVLIQAGANVSAVNKEGHTALIEAANADDLDSVKLLIEAGAQVDLRKKDGCSAWDMTGDDKIRELLEAHGATPGKRDDPEETPAPLPPSS